MHGRKNIKSQILSCPKLHMLI